MTSSLVIESLGYASGLALHYLSDAPMTGYELAAKMGISHSGASKHIRILTKRGLIHVVDKRSETGMGCPAKVFAAKVKHPKPDDDRRGINGIDKTRFAELKDLLTGCSMTAEDVADSLEITVASAKTRLRYWMEQSPTGKQFRIAKWVLSERGRAVYVPCYSFGSAPDAKKPKPLGNGAAVQRYREKKRLIVNRQQLLARPRAGGPVAVSPFDQLLTVTGTRKLVSLTELEAA